MNSNPLPDVIPPSSAGSRYSHIAALDGVRGFAVLAVMLHHLIFLDPERPEWLLRGGFLGVDIFLVLSAFLISSSIHREIKSGGIFDWRAFLKRRARRLLPALLLLFAVHAVVLVFLGDPIREEVRQIVLNLLFISNWQLSFGHHAPLDLVHLWSLSVEVQLYALLAVAGVFRARWGNIPQRRLIGVLVALVVMVGMVRIGMWHADVNPEAMFQRTDLRLDALAAGILSAMALTISRNQLRTRMMTMASLIILTGMMFFSETQSFWINHGGYTIAAVAAGVLVWGASSGTRPFGLLLFRPLRMLGTVSYSVYLWHLPIFIWIRRMDLPLGVPIQMVVASISAIAVGTASYWLVERRFLSAAAR